MKFFGLCVIVMLSSSGFTSFVSAGLILDTYASGTPTPDSIESFAMTDFAFTSQDGTSRVSSISSPLGGSLTFVDGNNAALPLTHYRTRNGGWWNNGETSGYDVFTTTQSWLTILFPENSFAFSFNVGPNFDSDRNHAWIKATVSNGEGISSRYWFNASSNNAPGFDIYASRNVGGCSTITSITIEPNYRGKGNLSINQGNCNTASGSSSVPEPSSIVLLLIGLMGFALTQIKKKRVRSAMRLVPLNPRS